MFKKKFNLNFFTATIHDTPTMCQYRLLWANDKNIFATAALCTYLFAACKLSCHIGRACSGFNTMFNGAWMEFCSPLSDLGKIVWHTVVLS